MRLEEKFIDISLNISLLMETLLSKLKLFGEVGGSNFEIISEGKSRDNEYLEKELRKNPEKKNPSLNVVNPS